MLSLKKLFCAALLLLVVGSVKAYDEDTLKFTTIIEHPITSIKNQGKSGTCWAFSSIAYIESELLRLHKKSYDLSESFLIYNTLVDRAKNCVRLHGDPSFCQGGGFYDFVYCLENHGMCPEEAMPKQGSLYGDTLFNHGELAMIGKAYVNAVAKSKSKKLSNIWCQGLDALCEKYMGKLPETFTYEGKEYTPKSFVKDNMRLNPGDYISITSFTHYPYYKTFVLELIDNWRHCQMYNLPLDEFMEVMDYAIKNGFTFGWGADISEDHFPGEKSGRGVTTFPDVSEKADNIGSDQARWIGTTNIEQAEKNARGEKIITPELRQESYDNWTTVDDHEMLIYGLAKDQHGKEYYMMKNSWGNYNKFHGIGYISKAYMAYKTINIIIHKDGIPKKIAKKMGL